MAWPTTPAPSPWPAPPTPQRHRPILYQRKDNDFLNHSAKTGQGWGYCVFGKVTEGMDVVNKIKVVKTGAQDVPQETITIERVTVAG